MRYDANHRPPASQNSSKAPSTPPRPAERVLASAPEPGVTRATRSPFADDFTSEHSSPGMQVTASAISIYF